MAQSISNLNLAFLGDAVYELFVREYIMNQYSGNVNALNKKTTELSKALTQSIIVDFISELLDEEEKAVYKRGRNAKSVSLPKSCTPAQYRKATGLEALIGYLYLEKRGKRINEILEYGIKEYYKSKQES